MSTRGARQRATSAGPGSRGWPHLHLASWAGIGAAALYAGLASGARTFTVPADVAVSIPGAVFLAALVAERIRPDRGPWRRIDPGRPPAREHGDTALPWLLVIALLVGVELASYFHGGPRSDYPTISYGLTTLFRSRAARAAGWFAWLTAGWYLARR